MLGYSFLVWRGGSNDSSNPWRVGVRAALLPPRPDRRRYSLAAIHRQVCEELLFRAIEELISTNRIEQYRPRRN